MVTAERCSQRRTWRKNRHPETQDPPRAGERIFSERKPILTRGGSNTDCSEHCSEHCGEHEIGSSGEDHGEPLSKPCASTTTRPGKTEFREGNLAEIPDLETHPTKIF